MAEFDDKLNSILSNPDAMAQIMQLAQSISGGGNTAAAPPPQQPQPVPQPFTPPKPQSSAAPPSFTPPSNPSPLSALGNMDPKLMMKLLPLIQELGSSQDSDARRLLHALSPYLKPERQEKIDRALQLARLFHIGRQFLTKWEG